MPTPILIHGPTASGKTALALALAKRFGGEVVNADSQQVYRDLSVLSARPGEPEMAEAPHHLFGVIDGAERFSAGRWLDAAAPIVDGLLRKGRTPIVVGGTGLYFHALIEGLDDIPPTPDEIRAEVRDLVHAEGVEGLAARVAKVDPGAAARIDPADRQRLSRAYEVWLAAGTPLSQLQTRKTPPLLPKGGWLGVALTPPRARLYARIDRRFDGMLVSGAMQEVRALADRRLDPDLPIMKAHGVPWLIAYVRGEMSAEAAAERAKRDTRRYAKRQFTWIAHRFPFWPRIPAMETETRLRVVHALHREIDQEN